MRFIAVIGIALLAWVIIWGLLWNSNSTNTLREARQLIEAYGANEYFLMIEECSKLILEGKELTLFGKSIPEKLVELRPEYIRVSGSNCEVNLYKVPGKGIGYFVTKRADGSFDLSWHDYFKSWDSHNIALEARPLQSQ